jgi:hypothetical protein
VNDALARVDARGTAIAPFGFEITQDHAFLKKPLQRLFVYLAVPRDNDDGMLLSAFGDALVGTLQERHPAFAAGLHGLALPNRQLVLSEQGTAVVFVFNTGDAQSALQEWARFLVLAAPCIALGTLPQIAGFPENGAKRAFVFQLAVIFHHLFDAGQCSEADLARLLPLTHAPPPDLRLGKFARSVFSPPTRREDEALRDIVIPQALRVLRHLEGPPPRRELVRVRDPHGELYLSADLDASCWRNAARIAVERYVAY